MSREHMKDEQILSRPSRSLGSYELLFSIGSGGAGEVFAALDRSRHTPVAVKVLKQREQGMGEKALQRFQAEVSVLFRLRHPGVVTALDAGLEQGHFYLVMELCRGPSLQSLLNVQPTLPFSQVLWIARQLASSLDYIHEQGLVHRDIKPSNLLLVEDGLKVTDFGTVHQDEEKLTETGDTLGTPQFMAPEQILGKRIDHRADVFSAALILYACLVGKLPFTGSPMAIMYQLVHNDSPLPCSLRPDLPPGLDEVFTTALARDREQRFYSMVELLGALQDALPGVRPAPLQLPPTLQSAIAAREEHLHQRIAAGRPAGSDASAPDLEDSPTVYDTPTPLQRAPEPAPQGSEPTKKPGASESSSIEATRKAPESSSPADPARAEPHDVAGWNTPPSPPRLTQPELGVWRPPPTSPDQAPPQALGNASQRSGAWDMPTQPEQTRTDFARNSWGLGAQAEEAPQVQDQARYPQQVRLEPTSQPHSIRSTLTFWGLLLIGVTMLGAMAWQFLKEEGVVSSPRTMPPLTLAAPEAGSKSHPEGGSGADPALATSADVGQPGASQSGRTGPGGAQDAAGSAEALPEGEGDPTSTSSTADKSGAIAKSPARGAKEKVILSPPATPKGPVGFLQVRTTPSGRIFVDGAPMGASGGPRVLIPVGSHTLMLKPAGTGQSVSRAIEVREGRTLQLEYDFLERAWRVPAGGR